MVNATSALRPVQQRAFRKNLLRWYAAHQRQLPWRGERDAYKIWVSEIMLQQTRVAVVIERYGDFLRRFASLEALACAELDDVLAAWSGLGYYRRARNLHAAARALHRDHKPIPQTAAELRTLAGIGRYTSAAIASIAFHEPVAVVDGNVERVLARLFAPPRKTMTASFFWSAAQQLLHRNTPGDFNQAMMELGATVCLPATPLCAQCPIAKLCRSRHAKNNSVSRIAAPRRRVRQHYLVARRKNSVYLVQRLAGATLMPGMWELPRAPLRNSETSIRARHSITNTDYEISANVVNKIPRPYPRGKWISLRAVDRIPLTGLAHKLLLQAFPLHRRRLT